MPTHLCLIVVWADRNIPFGQNGGVGPGSRPHQGSGQRELELDHDGGNRPIEKPVEGSVPGGLTARDSQIAVTGAS